MTERIAILGSGTGTIARAVIEGQHGSPHASYAVCALITTSETSGFNVLAQDAGIPACVITYRSAQEFTEQLLDCLHAHQVTLLLLAGFTRLLPAPVISELHGRVINTHPAPLPDFGGKGMYGLHVHQAVLNAKRKSTAITVHWVTDQYDEGAAIAVREVPVLPNDTAETLQQRVKDVEGPFVAQVVASLCGGD